MQVFYEFNARKLYNVINVFKGLSTAPVFMAIIVITIVVQWLAIVYGGKFMHTIPLDQECWTKCMYLAVVPLPLGLFLRLIPITEPTPDVKRDYSAEQIDAISKVKKTSLKEASDRVLSQLKVAGALSASLRRQRDRPVHAQPN